jgi:hypothetical protein
LFKHLKKEIQSQCIVSTQNLPIDFAEFNELIGLPTSKIPPFEKFPIFDYEFELISNIEHYKDYALNKARGIGATEIILRWILFQAIHNKIPRRKYLIVTGIRLGLAKDHIRRVQEMCINIPEVVRESSQYHITINQSEIIAIPANPTAIRGYENVGVIFADEAAHWNLLDDGPVLEAIEPHRTKSDANIIIVSTPNGRRGFFGELFHNPDTKYFRDTKNWSVSEGLLIDTSKVEKIKKEDPYRFEQEYNCKFLSTRYSAIPQEILEITSQNSVVYQLET